MLEYIKINQNIIFVVSTLLVLGLSIYLGYLIYLLKLQSKQKALTEKLKLEEDSKREKFVRESILIISKATLQGQCETSEACVRLKNLVSFYPELNSVAELVALNSFYNDIKDLAYLNERAKLSKQEKFNQDKKRFAAEDAHSEAFSNSLNYLVSYFEKMH